MAATVRWGVEDRVEETPVDRWRRIALAPVTRIVAGIVVLLGVLLLGLLVHLPQIAHRDLRVDQALVQWRTPVGDALAIAFTTAAKEVVGAAVLAVGLVVLLVRRRFVPAAQLLLTAGLGWGVAYALKYVIDRARPPASLELVAPDSPVSFPSGHTTTAAILVVVVWFVLAGARRFRIVAGIAALAFAGAVAVSRVYLGDHYPTDVAASFGVVLAAVLLVSGVLDLPPLLRLRDRLPASLRGAGGRGLHASR
jgi:undecaprenyl-diphosphatase